MIHDLHFSAMCLQYISCSGLVIDIKATVSESEILLKGGGFIRLSNHNVIKSFSHYLPMEMVRYSISERNSIIRTTSLQH